ARSLRVGPALADRRLDCPVLHGDPHWSNFLAGPGGCVMIDFESVCRGPVEWDLSPSRRPRPTSSRRTRSSWTCCGGCAASAWRPGAGPVEHGRLRSTRRPSASWTFCASPDGSAGCGVTAAPELRQRRLDRCSELTDRWSPIKNPSAIVTGG